MHLCLQSRMSPKIDNYFVKLSLISVYHEVQMSYIITVYAPWIGKHKYMNIITQSSNILEEDDNNLLTERVSIKTGSHTKILVLY